MVRPRGRGGVASVVDLVVPELGDRVTAVESRQVPSRLSRADVLHLHPSLRWRALVRDAVLHRHARRRGLRTVVQLHGWSRRLAAHLDRDPLARGLLRRSLFDADALLVLTEPFAEQLVSWGAAPARVRVVPNPYDPRGIPDRRAVGRPTVLFLGRFEPGKGADVLVEAVRGLDVDLVLAGDGSQRADLERRASGRVTFPGWVDAAGKRELLARASVLALPSREEAAPVAVLEALAAGVPVVATRSGAIPAMVGEAGLLLDDLGAEAVASALREALGRTFPRADVRAHHPSAVARAWAESY